MSKDKDEDDDFKIIPLKSKVGDNKHIPDFFPNINKGGFRLLLIAPSNSGKTTVINNMLSRDQFGYNKVFKNNIFLFSPSNGIDDALDEMKIKEENKYLTLDLEVLENILNTQKEIIEEKGLTKSPYILLILDDVIGEIPSTKNNIIWRLFFQGRKYRISLIICSQSYKLLDPKIRVNASQQIYFARMNEKELYKIQEEQVNSKHFQESIKLVRESGNYSFLYCNNEKPANERYSINFSKRIYFK